MKKEKTLFYEAPQAEFIEVSTEQCFANSTEGDTEYLTGDEGFWY